MRIALINPPVHRLIRTTLPKFIDDNEGDFQPLGIMSLSSYVKRACGAEHEITIIDAALEKLAYDAIAARVRELRCDVVGITCWTFSLSDSLETAAAVKRAVPGASVVLGGPHVMIYPEETVARAEVDFVIAGDGETPFLELVRRLAAGGGDLGSVPNLYYKEGGAVRKSASTHVERDLDALPFPDRKGVDVSRYLSMMEPVHPYTTMMTARGCPFHCTFCFKQDSGWRSRSVDSMLAEIKECRAAGIRNFFIFDETFTVDRRRTREFCDRLIAEKLDVVWSCRSRVDTVDEETLLRMKAAGCGRISFGVESADETVLATLDKRIKLPDVLKTFSAAKRAGIKTLADFMVCCPGETPEMTERTVGFACELDPDYIQFSLFTLLPATRLYDRALAEGVVKGDVWREYARNPSADFKPPLWGDIPEEESLRILNSAYKKFYLRPGRVARTLLKASSPGQLMAYMKAGFGLLGELLRPSAK